MRSKKPRLTLSLDPDIDKRLRACGSAGNYSQIVQDALKSWLDRRGVNELDDHFGRRLDRMSSQLNTIERDQRILLESLALHVRLNLQRDAHLPEPDASVRAKARDRFEQFVKQVGRHLARGDHTLNPPLIDEADV